MFGIDTQEKIPEKFLTDHAAWDGYIGHIWYNLLAFANFTEESSVIDIAPGTSLKLGIALSKFNYRGHLYVVDSSEEVLKILEQKYASLLPQAKIHWMCGTFKDQAAHLPENPDYLLGNHILDDMLLATADTPQEQKNTFSWAIAYTDSPSDAVRKSWQRLLNDPAHLARSKQAVRDEMVDAVKKLDPACFILSQYPSSTLYDHGMDTLNDHAFSIFEMIKDAFKTGLADPSHIQTLLGANRNFGNAHIGEHILNAKYWMLCQSKKI